MYVVIFKQKTAYEMRISDWSSDVCSSDLLLKAAEQVIELFALALLGAFLLARMLMIDLAGYRLRSLADEHAQYCLILRPVRLEVRPIGRASGRERVCQDV